MRGGASDEKMTKKKTLSLTKRLIATRAWKEVVQRSSINSSEWEGEGTVLFLENARLKEKKKRSQRRERR